MAKLIYVVEDDEFIRQGLCEVLEGEGHQVKAFANGRLALTDLQAQRAFPDLILLDRMMPVMDGDAFLAETVHCPVLSGIPVLLFSAHREAKDSVANPQVKGIIQKPVDLDKLLDSIAAHASPSRASSANNL